MTRYDLLKMNVSVLEIFLKNKIDIKDVTRLKIFEEYTDMRNRGEKFGYVIHFLSDKYRVAPRSVSNIVHRMTGTISV